MIVAGSYRYRPSRTTARQINHPDCLEPSGVSACLVCFEDFTEGCETAAFCEEF